MIQKNYTTLGNDDFFMNVSEIRDSEELEAVRDYIKAHHYPGVSENLTADKFKEIADVLFKKKDSSLDEIKKALIVLTHQKNKLAHEILNRYLLICPPVVEAFAKLALEESIMWIEKESEEN
jgi:hypothetical protein